MASTEHLVASTGHLVASIGHLVVSSGHLMASTGHQVASTGHQVANKKHLVELRHLVASTGHLVASTGTWREWDITLFQALAVALAPLAAFDGASLKALLAEPCTGVFVVLVNGKQPVIHAMLAVQLGIFIILILNY